MYVYQNQLIYIYFPIMSQRKSWFGTTTAIYIVILVIQRSTFHSLDFDLYGIQYFENQVKSRLTSGLCW